MCEVKTGQVYGEVTVVSVRKATARQLRDMGSKFAAASRAGYESNDLVVSFTEDGSKLVQTMTLGGFIRQYVK